MANGTLSATSSAAWRSGSGSGCASGSGSPNAASESGCGGAIASGCEHTSKCTLVKGSTRELVLEEMLKLLC